MPDLYKAVMAQTQDRRDFVLGGGPDLEARLTRALSVLGTTQYDKATIARYVLDVLALEPWGSDCRCGNATAGSNRCDVCGSTQTRPLFSLAPIAPGEVG